MSSASQTPFYLFIYFYAHHFLLTTTVLHSHIHIFCHTLHYFCLFCHRIEDSSLHLNDNIKLFSASTHMTEVNAHDTTIIVKLQKQSQASLQAKNARQTCLGFRNTAAVLPAHCPCVGRGAAATARETQDTPRPVLWLKTKSQEKHGQMDPASHPSPQESIIACQETSSCPRTTSP